MIDSEEPKKEKTLKYMHYYPRFLIKNFCKITEKYDLYTKKYSKDNISEDYICAHRANSKNQEIDFFKYEEKEDELTMHNNRKIEDIMAEILSMKDLKIDLLDKDPQKYYENMKKFEENFEKRFKKEEMLIFIKHLLIKAPKLRVSKGFVKYIDQRDSMQKIVNNLIYDSFIVLERNIDGMQDKFKKGVRDDINELGNKENLECVLLFSNFLFPLIDPGYNFFKTNEFRNHSFVLQLNENYFLLFAQKEIINKIKLEIETLEGQNDNEAIFNMLKRFILEGNSLLNNIYLSKKTIEFKILFPGIEKHFLEIDKFKKPSAVFYKKAKTEWRIPIIVDGNETIKLTTKSYDDISICQTLIYNKEFKHIFEGCDAKEVRHKKMKDLEGKKIFIENGKIFLR